jgi:hypothetical protein
LKLSTLCPSLLARLVWSTRIIDRAYVVFDHLRSRLVLASAPDRFYDAYNDLTYARRKLKPKDLLAFEERAVSRYFPPPPAAVLIGAAGAGREAVALARLGYRVVAFEPVPGLAQELATISSGLAIESFVGRYETLPIVRSIDGTGIEVDLSRRIPFQAAIIGWTSFSHLRSDARRAQALAQVGALTVGPILLSYFSDPKPRFSAEIGYYRGYSTPEIHNLARRVGFKVVLCDDNDPWPHAVLRTRLS